MQHLSDSAQQMGHIVFVALICIQGRPVGLQACQAPGLPAGTAARPNCIVLQAVHGITHDVDCVTARQSWCINLQVASYCVAASCPTHPQGRATVPASRGVRAAGSSATGCHCHRSETHIWLSRAMQWHIGIARKLLCEMLLTNGACLPLTLGACRQCAELPGQRFHRQRCAQRTFHLLSRRRVLS